MNLKCLFFFLLTSSSILSHCHRPFMLFKKIQTAALFICVSFSIQNGIKSPFFFYCFQTKALNQKHILWFFEYCLNCETFLWQAFLFKRRLNFLELKNMAANYMWKRCICNKVLQLTQSLKSSWLLQVAVLVLCISHQRHYWFYLRACFNYTMKAEPNCYTSLFKALIAELSRFHLPSKNKNTWPQKEWMRTSDEGSQGIGFWLMLHTTQSFPILHYRFLVIQ